MASTPTTRRVYYTLSRHRKRERAKRSLASWIKTQTIWDTAFERVVGQRPYPPPEQVYSIRKVRNRPIWRVVWHDPTL